MDVAFDGPARRINLGAGTVAVDVPELYSRWKDWVLEGMNSRWPAAFAPTGGDSIDPESGTKVPLYAFLLNGWRVKPQEANHTLTVTGGILLVAGGGDPFVDTDGPWIVRVNYQQPVQAIKVETGTSGLTPTESAQLAALDGRLPAELVSGKMAAALDPGERIASAEALLDLADGIEPTFTFRQAMRIMVSVIAGRSMGYPAGPVRFRDVHNTKDRVVATLDSADNRTAVVVDAS